MSLAPLTFLSQPVLEALVQEIPEHTERYLTGDFNDLARENGWAIETSSAKWDPTVADQLDPSPGSDAEIRNSLLIFNGVEGMTPALAREERLWARLCHVECLGFARQRWLKGEAGIEKKIEVHFFAQSLPQCRDDNAIARLWWNGYIASLACPGDVEAGLRLLLSRANIRLQIIDRADTAFRAPLVQGIFRLIARDPWFEESDAAVSHFMREVNKRSGARVFEAMDTGLIDAHLAECLQFAKNEQ